MATHRQGSVFKRFLEQKKSPTFTVLSLLTTTFIWLALSALLLLDPEDGWGRAAQFWISITMLCLGVLINGSLGAIANGRGEFCGGRVAALGIALWLLTAFVLFRLRHLW
jgi:hypothetical protein